MIRTRLTVAWLSMLFAGWLVIPASVNAAPIRYVFSGVGYGSMGSTQFDFAAFVVTVSADTDSSTAWGDPNSTYYGWETFIRTNAATMEVAGVGVARISNPLLIWTNPNCECMGLSARPIANYSDFLLLSGTGFDVDNPYELTTSIGPVTAGQTQAGSYLGILTTDLGDLRLDLANEVSFQAALVPLPSVAWLFGLAMGLVIKAGVAAKRRPGIYTCAQ